MEPQKFYDYTYGVYCVHFPNKRGLSMDEIEIIFSEFGKVVSVAKSGDDYGYRFVKYKKEDEVIRCVEGLRNHESIKLKPRDPNYKKNKKQNNHNNQPGTSHGQKNHEHNGQRTEFNDDNNRLENKEEPKSNLIEIPQPKPKKLSVGEQRIYDARWGPQNPYEGETIEQRARRLLGRLYDPINRGSLLRRPEIPAGGLMSARAKFGADNVQNSLVTSYGRSDEIVNKIVRASDNSDAAGLLVEVPVPCLKTVEYPENLPRLVMRNSNSNGAGNMGGERGPLNLDVLAPTTVTAEQVIVANIHSDFGVNYILHLFRKHNPLGVSEMKIAPSRGIRFCIVYLESLHQAYAIEKEFDRYDLSGKDLIVLRPETLLDLAA